MGKNQLVPLIIAYQISQNTIDRFCRIIPCVLSGLLATRVIADVWQGLSTATTTGARRSSRVESWDSTAIPINTPATLNQSRLNPQIYWDFTSSLFWVPAIGVPPKSSSTSRWDFPYTIQLWRYPIYGNPQMYLPSPNVSTLR